LCRPTIAVINSLTIEQPSTVDETIHSGESELVQTLPEDGCLVLNGDDPGVRRLARETKAQVILVGRNVHCDWVAERVRYGSGRLSFEVEDTRISVPLSGRHRLHTVLAAYAVGRRMELQSRVIAQALAGYQAPAGQGRVYRVAGLTLIDNTHEGDLNTRVVGLEALSDWQESARRVAVFGVSRPGLEGWEPDLGQRLVSRCRADRVLACGSQGRRLIVEAQKAGMPAKHTVWCPEPAALADAVATLVHENDVVFVDGDCGDAVECLVDGRWNSISQKAA
jgi:UDP-N-acetylmuramoyl-tripeptide--D-alanyl-D-alanine ligase